MQDVNERRRKTPLMGWASWNCFRTDINEEKLKQQAELLLKTGLFDHGYTFFNIDDGYFGGRGEDGKLQFHKERFPNGIKVLSDYVHSLGMSAGIYTDAGDNTCGHYYDEEGENGLNVGVYGHEEEDLRQLLVENNFDFLKVDWCGGLRLGLDEEDQYTKLGKIIRQIETEENRPIVYNVCRWEFPGAWVANVADSWRTGVDIAPNFDSVLYQIDQMKALRRFCMPGHVNDSDMMQVGNGMSQEEDKSHFAMWCMLSTPLMLGCDLSTLSEETLNILKNDELIALNQDVLCEQAYVFEEYKGKESVFAEGWIKKLADGGFAIAVLNRSNKKVGIKLDFGHAGLTEIKSVRNISSGRDERPGRTKRFFLKPHETVVFRVYAQRSVEVPDVNAKLEYSETNYEKIGVQKAILFASLGKAILVDVRNTWEYKMGHYEGAVNYPYQDLYLKPEQLLTDKNQKIILYCATGKRAFMALGMLKMRGFSDVCLTDSYN